MSSATTGDLARTGTAGDVGPRHTVDRADRSDTADQGDTSGGVRWLTDTEQQTWRAFLDMHARLLAQLGREMQDATGLSGADFAVLVQLSDRPDDSIRVLELARELRWEKSRLSHQLTRMQQRGLVTRAGCTEDRRGASVSLTTAGRRAVESAAPMHVESVRRYLIDALSADELATLHSIATSTVERLGSEAGCPTTCPPTPDPQ